MRNFLLAGVMALGLSSAAQANIVIAEGPISAGGLDNVLFTNSPAPGSMISGVLNSTPYLVNFTGNETLVGSGGQARLEAQDGGLNFVNFSLGSGLGFDTASFNVNTTSTLQGGILTVTAFDQFNNAFTSNIDITGNGQNFVNLTTDAAQVITSVTLSSTLNFADLRQVRLGDAQPFGGDGIGGGISSGVPEPSTWAMMLIGFAGLGFVSSRKARSITIGA